MLLRTALLSCVFFLGFVLVIQLALVVVARWKGSAGLIFNGWSWAVFSGVIWLISTSLAFRIFAKWLRAQLADQ